MEIERKWHMEQEPALPVRTHTRMAQSYLSLIPEVRIRKYEDLMHGAPDTYELTLKSEGTIAREEINKPLTAEEYEILLRMTNGLPPIVKDHRSYDYQGHLLEFSIVDPELPSRFTYAEVEFSSIEEAKAFAAPDWFGRETTEEQGFRMKGYWKKTRLEG
ncbi:MAG: adenylate cyclase [Ruminococcaceae bacterium]|jgi:CYTH domain-containing protein|nr:adenylate cyclase [Oscillospiraceae bacterium]